MTDCECRHCRVVPHESGCAVHNAPALPTGRCDCSARELDHPAGCPCDDCIADREASVED